MQKAFIKSNVLAAFVVFIVSVLIYIPSLNNEFVWDDVIVIEKEYHKFKDRSFLSIFIPKSSKKNKSYYRPLTYYSIYLDFTIWKSNPLGFHLTNILVNSACAVLVFFLFLMILKRFNIRARENIALFSAIIFAVHPMHVESVSWIAGRTDLLCSMFFLAAFITHIKSSAKIYLLVLTCLFFYFSLLSKELAVAFPFTILAFEYFSKKRFGRSELIRITAYFIFLIIYLLLRNRTGGVIVPDINPQLPGSITPSAAPEQAADFGRYLSAVKTLFSTYLFYFYKLVTPFWFSSFISEVPRSLIYFILSLFAFALLGYAFVVSYLKKSGFKAFCIFWLLIVLGPSVLVAVTQVSTTPLAERYLYLPVAPFSLLSVFLLFRLNNYKKIKEPVLIFLIVVIIIFSFFTVLRQSVWQDRVTFWTDAAKNTYNQVPIINLGMALIDNNSLEEGIQVLEENLKSAGNTSSLMRAIAYNNLGIAYIKIGKNSIAKQKFLDAIETNPRFYKSYYHLGIIYLSYGSKTNSPEYLETAREYFLDAIKYKKNYARAYLGLAKIYVEYGEIGKAKQLAKQALKYGLIAPMDQQALFILNLN